MDRVPPLVRRDHDAAGFLPPAEAVRAVVGRAREMEILLRALEDAISGRQRLILLAGEPGIGKTRLADEVATHALEAGALVLWGRCWEAGGAPAYWPWIQSLRGLVRGLEPEELRAELGAGAADVAQILPELTDVLGDLPDPPPASPESARFRLFDAVSTFLARSSERLPLVLVLEDLHAADASSLLMLRFVGGELARTRVLIVGTYRDVELTRDHPLVSALPELGRAQGAVRLSLSGLTPPDVALFIETIAGTVPSPSLVAKIHGETEGNPLFVGEVVRLLASEGSLSGEVHQWAVPEGIREVIGRRLGRLSEDCRRLLTLASVLGRDFTLQALERIADRPADDLLEALRDAVDAKAIVDAPGIPGRFRFGHSLVRDTLYGDLYPGDRIRLHRSVGEALEGMYAPNPEPYVAELAYHFFQAAPGGGVQKAIDYARLAGERALALLAYEDAVRLFDMALRALERLPDEGERCRLLLALGDAQARAGDTPASQDTFLEAAAIATRMNAPDLLARAALGYGGRIVWLRAGTDRQLIPLLEQALAALPPDDGALRVRLLARLAGALRDQPTMEPRAALSAEAVEMARRMHDPGSLMYALVARCTAVALGPDGLDQQLALGDEIDGLATRAGDLERAMDACWFRFIVFMTTGRVTEARGQQALITRLADELRSPSQRWYAGVMATILALQDGRFDEAEQLIARTFELGRRAQDWDAGASRLFALFALRREQGRLIELEEDRRRALDVYPGYRSFRCMLVVSLCELGHLDDARRMFHRLAEDGFAALPKDNEWLANMTLLAEAAEALEEVQRAGTLYDLLAPYAGLVGLVASEVSMGPVFRPLGVLAAMLGRYEDASRHFEDSLEMCERMGARPWLARTQYQYARMLLGRGRTKDRPRAVELLRAALEISEEVGLTAIGGKVTELLAGLGQRPRRPRGSPAGKSILTPRELEVAGLVAEGLSNRGIAKKLYLSERTVETHVQNILLKLGYNSRAQVAAWAVSEGLPGPGT